MKNYIFIIAIVALTACSGSQIFSREWREKSVQNVYLNVRNCESGKFVWISDKKDNVHGWKSVREYACVGSALAKQNPALDNKIYTKEQAKAEKETNPYVSTLFVP